MNDEEPTRIAQPVTLEYALPGTRRSFSRWIGILLCVGAADSYLAFILAFVDTETIVATGGVMAVVGLLLTIFSSLASRGVAFFLGIEYLAVVAGTFALIHFNRWSPTQAHTPALFITGAQMIISTVLTIMAMFEPRRQDAVYAASN